MSRFLRDGITTTASSDSTCLLKSLLSRPSSALDASIGILQSGLRFTDGGIDDEVVVYSILTYFLCVALLCSTTKKKRGPGGRVRGLSVESNGRFAKAMRRH